MKFDLLDRVRVKGRKAIGRIMGINRRDPIVYDIDFSGKPPYVKILELDVECLVEPAPFQFGEDGLPPIDKQSRPYKVIDVKSRQPV